SSRETLTKSRAAFGRRPKVSCAGRGSFEFSRRGGQCSRRAAEAQRQRSEKFVSRLCARRLVFLFASAPLREPLPDGAPMINSYVRAESLTKVYRSGTTDLVVFAGLSLGVEKGEMLALVGESGAGKSTLLHLLGGLDRPSSGTIYYGSTEISGLADSEQADF